MILKLENVKKTFKRSGKAVSALVKVDLELWPGELIGIYGPSGAGKSTLLQIAAGLMLPDSGRVLYRGDNSITHLKGSELQLFRQVYIGCVWQTSSLQPGLTILDNIVFPALAYERHSLREGAAEWAMKLLKRCFVDHCADAYPHEVSAGERQCAQLAQALVGTPQLLICDEPASNLDFYQQEMFMGLLRSLAKEAKVGVIVAETDAAVLMHVQTIIYINQGVVTVADAMQGYGDRIFEGHVEAATKMRKDDA